MTLKLIRGLWLLGMVLALALLLIVPLDTAWRVLTALLVIALVAYGWRRAGRRAGLLRESLRLADDLSLPSAAWRQPVLLVCGDGLDAVFGAADGAQDAARPRLRMTANACYLGVSDSRRLPTLVSALLARRPGWNDQLGVLFVVNPGEQRDEAQLAGQVRALAHQLALVRRQGRVLPLLLASYLRGGRALSPWFVWGHGLSCPQVHDAGSCSRLDYWQRQADDNEGAAQRMRASVQLTGAAAWWREQVLPHLGASAPVACAMTLVESLPGERPDNLWQQWLHRRLALVRTGDSVPTGSGLLALPDAALPFLALRPRATPRQRAAVEAIWLFTLAGLIALFSSAWNNDRLIRHVGADLQRYLSIPFPERNDQPAHALREEALGALREHSALLDHYHRDGEPLPLGFGLYRDALLRERLLEVLLAHRQPPPPPQPVKAPTSVRLDSLSLFASGSARLRPESTKVLVNALVGIKAQPGWLIVIAGHTDATGSAPHNLKLSRERAAAVRDWMQGMGDIPDSCFAVQGFGASQPIASNEDADGRRSNRRVDIRLVPTEGACTASSTTPG